MVKITRYLLLLHLLIWTNSYAWYCTYTPTDNGYMVEDSLQCYDIEPLIALENHWCVNYQPTDPICDQFATCLNQTEQRSVACTEPNTTGVLNQSRYYECNTGAWTQWATVSNNCTPLPQTCFENMEERTLACGPEYTGTYVEQRSTTCSTPYSDPVQSAWITISSSCTLKVNDPTSIESPVNPVSPIKNITTPVPITRTEPVIANPDPVQIEMTQPVTEVETAKSEQSTKKEETTQPKATQEKEIVPGFGIVTSFKLLKQGNFFQQKGIEDNVRFDQEQSYARDQELLLDLIQSNGIGVDLYNLTDRAWRGILYSNPLQSNAFDD